MLLPWLVEEQPPPTHTHASHASQSIMGIEGVLTDQRVMIEFTIRSFI